MVHSEEWKRNWKRPNLKTKPGLGLVITEWGWAVQYPGFLKFGKFIDIGFGTYINSRYGVVIEDDVQIGSYVCIYSSNTIDDTRGPVLLKKGCMIGTHSVIMPGVVIGKNAIVGAFSLVKENVPDGATVVGIPARVKKRIS